MWMTDFVREVKRQLRDVYGLTPSREADGEPCFDNVPDGLYPMVISCKSQHVCFIAQKMHLLELKLPRGESTTC